MAETQAGSTVPRRQLGRYLRDLRVAAGLTARAAARELERSEPTLWRIENGHTATRSLDVEQMCRLYGADQDLTKALMALAKETRARGWWQAYGDVVPDWLDLYIGLEAAATRLDWYETELVPGVFQTEDYARALIQLDNADKSAEEIARRHQLRMGRQAILRRPIDPPLLRVALRESVLRAPVGGREVMAAQLGKLAEASGLPNVSIRVVPFGAGLHFGILSGAFEILRFPVNGSGEDTEPPTVYAELFTGALFLDKPHEIAHYDQAFGAIWEAALDEEASRERLHNAAEEW
ncbi:MAG TPA: helix-turn-helix transcriptional regulator [Streptosporangiaceae bacterium]|nr:helix-turn-helix transcriptional regulator [Streptosporangiaceae bacterium]